MGFGQFKSINFDFSSIGYNDNLARPLIFDDGVLLEGHYTNSAGKGGTHLSKVNFDGELQWQIRIDSLRTFVAPSSGGAIIDNSSILLLLAPNDPIESKGIRVLRLDFDGNLLNEYAWGDDLINEEPKTLEKYGDGWAILLKAYKANGNEYGLVQILDSNFAEKRRFVIKETTEELDTHSLLINQNNQFTLGYVIRHTNYNIVGSVSKYDSLGSLLWHTNLDTVDFNTWHKVITLIPVQNNRIIVAWANKTENIYPLLEDSPEIVCLDSNGVVLWKHIFYSKEIHQRINLIPTADGHFLGASGVEDFPSLENRAWVFKMTTEGEMLWEREFWDEINTIKPILIFENGVEMPSGDLLLTGFTYKDSIGNGPFNIDGNTWLLWTDSEGCMESGCDTLQLLTATELPNWSFSKKERRLSVLPNPVFESMVIVQDSDLKPITGVLTFQIYNSQGQPVGDLVKSRLPAHLTTAKDLPQGIYFLKITGKNGKKIQYIKFVKQ